MSDNPKFENAESGFDWSSSPDGTSVAVVDGITAVRFEGPEIMISEDGLVADPNELKPSGRVFHAPPESEADRNAALTQELVRDLHQQLMSAIAERDALREQLTAAAAEHDAALNEGVAVGGSLCGFVKCSLVIEQPEFSEGVAGGAWLEPARDLVLAEDLDAAYAERNAAIAERDAAIAERDAAHTERNEALASRYKAWENAEAWKSLLDGSYEEILRLRHAHSPTGGINGAPAGDGGSASLPPSTASLSAAVAPPKMGGR